MQNERRKRSDRAEADFLDAKDKLRSFSKRIEEIRASSARSSVDSSRVGGHTAIVQSNQQRVES